MRKIEWKKFLYTVMSGGMLLQMPGCTETTATITAIATSITAGGIIYLVSRVLQD